MSDYTYHTDNAVFSVPEGFKDGSVTVLEWTVDGDRRVALTVQREAPRGDATLEVTVRENLKTLARTLRGFKEKSAGPAEIEGAPGYRVEFEFKHETGALVQQQTYVRTDDAILVVGVTGRPADRATCDGIMDRVVRTLRIRER
jgi:hypothetical protein